MESKQPRICVSICQCNVDDLVNAIRKAEEVGDLIEIRLDCVNEKDLKSGLEQIRKILTDSSLPCIITFHPAEQGGESNLDREARFAFWSEQGLALPSSFYDLEIDIAEQFVSSGDSLPGHVDWSRVVCSYHDFGSVPGDLGQLYTRLVAVPARTLKVAVTVKDAHDCVELFDLVERALAAGREMIAIGMGTAGLATRILGPSRGAFLTYGALDEDSATAPGQISAQDLRTLYRIDNIDRGTVITGLVGVPIAHSLSPQVHNAAFKFAGMNAVYIPFEVSDLGSFFRRMIHPRTRELAWNLRGLSITAPHKTAVMNHLDWIEPSANEIGSVNTVVVDQERLCGYNTDATAVIRTLLGKFVKLGSLNGARVAIIGAGGVARAALHGLRRQSARTTVFARDKKKARIMANNFGANCESLNEAGFDGFDAVINATPLGTAGEFEAATPATASQLRGARLAYDLVYNPGETRFLREARAAGCQTLGGLSMFVAQAAEQFTLWTGAAAPEEVMYEAATRALQDEGSA